MIIVGIFFAYLGVYTNDSSNSILVVILTTTRSSISLPTVSVSRRMTCELKLQNCLARIRWVHNLPSVSSYYEKYFCIINFTACWTPMRCVQSSLRLSTALKLLKCKYFYLSEVVIVSYSWQLALFLSRSCYTELVYELFTDLSTYLDPALTTTRSFQPFIFILTAMPPLHRSILITFLSTTEG